MSRRRRAVHPPADSKVHIIPVEIFTEIFLFAIHSDPRSQRNLMLVCRRWHDIMLSTPGNRSQLRIGRSTQKKEVEAVIHKNRSLLDVIVDMKTETYGQRFNARKFHVCFIVAAKAASRWRSFELVLPPPHVDYEYLQNLQPLQHLEFFKLSLGCSAGNFLESLMAAIASTATQYLTEIEVADPNAMLCLGQPTFLHVFRSVRTLTIQLPKRMDNPVDILPYLERLEIFEAHHLCLPMYPPDVHLPLTQTLRSLHLERVSIQWVAERVFPRLERSSIIFPHHADAIQSVDMPLCSYLKYDSNNLGSLRHFHLPPLARLDVKCGQWSSRRGNLQLIALYPILSTVRSMTDLHLQVQCSEKMLGHILRLVPTLEQLWLGLSSPHALSKAFFQAFIARRPDESEMTRLSSQPIRPLCRQLKRLHLHYKRWLRGLEKTGIVQVFGDIVASVPAFLLDLSFDEGPKGQVWKVHKPVARPEQTRSRTCIGFPSSHGIVPLSAVLDYNEFTSPLFKESEYLRVSHRPSGEFPTELLFPFHNLRDLRIDPLVLTMQSGTQLPSNMPLFRTLKALYVRAIEPSLLAGRTLHSLERYKERDVYDMHTRTQSPLTEMPVCTRLDVSIRSLATFKLPQISELCVWFDSPESNMIWKKHVAVNANLSGLRLMRGLVWESKTNLIWILRSLPALETLIIVWILSTPPDVNLFREFVPVERQEISGLNKESGERDQPAVLCPKLESLQFEHVDPPKQIELRTVLHNIVTLRTVVGSPLKSFTFMGSGKKWELSSMDGRLTMKEVFPATAFKLDI